MGTFLKQIEDLDEVLCIHGTYVLRLLEILKNNLSEVDIKNIGKSYYKKKEMPSLIVTNNEFENILVHLQYFNFNFYIKVEDNSEIGDLVSKFNIKIQRYELDKYLPKKLLDAMENFEDENSAFTYVKE